MLHRLQEQNITILVSTPYMDEAMLCNRIALMREGSFLTIDTPQAIVENFREPLYAVSAANMSRLLAELRHISDIKSCYAFGDVHHVVLGTPAQIHLLTRRLQESGFSDVEIRPIPPTVEDCFMAMNTMDKTENYL
jgi:ABC-type multidrug transport system ATPase subunit